MEREERELRRLLAANVARVRGAQGLTVEEAAERGDMPARVWQRVEAGHTNATLRTLGRLSRALRVAVALLFWVRDPEPAEHRSRHPSTTRASLRRCRRSR